MYFLQQLTNKKNKKYYSNKKRNKYRPKLHNDIVYNINTNRGDLFKSNCKSAKKEKHQPTDRPTKYRTILCEEDQQGKKKKNNKNNQVNTHLCGPTEKKIKHTN